MSANILIYGANGYTGELITRFAIERSLRPIIAGRNRDAIQAIAGRYGLEYRIFALSDAAALDAALAEVDMVLHCAGPFSITARPMVEACIRNRKHYTDITGEISVFEMCASLDKKANEAGVMVMPGVGFDVVPSDCLALHLKTRLPSATHLKLAFYGMGRISHGTQATMTMNVGRGGAIRKDGEITPVPAAWKTREIDFGHGVVKTGVTIPWGDVATAYRSTGIPNIEVYSIVPASALKLMKLSRYLGWLLAAGPVQKFLQGKIPPGGPSDDERAKGRTLMWGEARDGESKVVTLQQGPEGYTLTAIAALDIAQRILGGDVKTGFQTPAMAYGPDLIMQIPGVTRTDL